MYASVQLFTDDMYSFLSEHVSTRGEAIVIAAHMFAAEHNATLVCVTLLTEHPDGFYVRDDITSDVVALLAWRAAYHARHDALVADLQEMGGGWI